MSYICCREKINVRFWISSSYSKSENEKGQEQMTSIDSNKTSMSLWRLVLFLYHRMFYWRSKYSIIVVDLIDAGIGIEKVLDETKPGFSRSFYYKIIRPQPANSKQQAAAASQQQASRAKPKFPDGMKAPVIAMNDPSGTQQSLHQVGTPVECVPPIAFLFGTALTDRRRKGCTPVAHDMVWPGAHFMSHSIQEGRKGDLLCRDFYPGVLSFDASFEHKRSCWISKQYRSRPPRIINLVGELFHFSFECKRAVPLGFTCLIGTIARLVDQGTPIHLRGESRHLNFWLLATGKRNISFRWAERKRIQRQEILL